VAAAPPGELSTTILGPGIDPIVEAQRRGTILLVVRMGNIDLEAPNTPAMDAPNPYVAPHAAAPRGPVMPGMPALVPGMMPPGTVTGPAGPGPMMPVPGPAAPRPTPAVTPVPVTAPATTSPAALAPAAMGPTVSLPPLPSSSPRTLSSASSTNSSMLPPPPPPMPSPTVIPVTVGLTPEKPAGK
jgi:hypothetical protein